MTAPPETIVIALGGNALSPPGQRATITEQFHHARVSLAPIVHLAQAGWRIAIVHGNGPQVGDELERNEIAEHEVSPLPLGVLVASTAGWIGYMMQQSLQNALAQAGVDREVLTIITQTRVSRDDPALREATKPIGHRLSEQRRAELEARGTPLARDGGGRWRRAAPSPWPVDVVEAEAVRRLVEQGRLVIAAGGGGPPVYLEDGRLEGVEAVVDKDRVAAVLGCRLRAHTLLILTDVDAVYEHWGTEQAKPISQLSVGEARALIARGGLGLGSMRPKVEAAIAFIDGGGQRAIIARLEDGLDAIRADKGTHIMGDGT